MLTTSSYSWTLRVFLRKLLRLGERAVAVWWYRWILNFNSTTWANFPFSWGEGKEGNHVMIHGRSLLRGTDVFRPHAWFQACSSFKCIEFLYWDGAELCHLLEWPPSKQFKSALYYITSFTITPSPSWSNKALSRVALVGRTRWRAGVWSVERCPVASSKGFRSWMMSSRSSESMLLR